MLKFGMTGQGVCKAVPWTCAPRPALPLLQKDWEGDTHIGGGRSRPLAGSWVGLDPGFWNHALSPRSQPGLNRPATQAPQSWEMLISRCTCLIVSGFGQKDKFFLNITGGKRKNITGESNRTKATEECFGPREQEMSRARVSKRP